MAGDLAQYFNSTNPFMWDQGMKVMEDSRAKSLADIAATQASTNKTNTMLPAELEHTQALAGQARQTARATEQANQVRDAVGVDAQKQSYMAKLYNDSSDADRKKLDNSMEVLRAYGSRVANGQPIPLPELQQIETSYPGISKFLTPQTYKQGLKAYNDWVQASSEYQRAKLAADASRYRTENPPPRGGATGPKNMSAEQAMTYYRRLANEATDPQQRALYEAEADRNELIMYRKAQEAALARGVGKPDLAQLPGGNIPTVQPRPLTPTPRQGQQPAAPAWTPPNGWK